jgi:hypothetical protein
MLNLLTSPRTRRTLRGVAGLVADAVRSIVNPAALVADQAEAPATEQVQAPEPAGLYEPDEMPDTAAIARAALSLDLANDNARRADRSKRAAKKILTRLPSGIYSGWKVYRKPSARMTPDLEAIGRILREHGIREIPMKPCADSLVVELVEAALVDVDTPALATV